MKAIGFTKSYPIDENESLIEYDAPKPKLQDYDLLVRVTAASVNPTDAKSRAWDATEKELSEPRILGFDATGIVEEVGSNAKGFSPGDRIYYAGDTTRQGSNAEYQAVDSRIVSLAPQNLTDIEAVVLPLTSLTAWEAFFDKMHIDKNESEKTILIIGGAGGVGSIATQIAKQVTNLTVISTASRSETKDWVKKMGADHVANHYDLVNSVKELGFDTVDYIFNTADVAGHWKAMAELIAPFGHICAITSAQGEINLSDLFRKAVSFSFELMFTRSIFETKDMDRQGKILTEVSNLIDEGKLKSTLNHTITGLSVGSIREAHRLIESGKTIGKIGISYE